MEKLVTSKGVYDIIIPRDSRPTPSGEIYMICPICSPTRQSHHQNEKKLAINIYKIPHPWRCNHCGEGGYVVDENYLRRVKIKPILENMIFISLNDPIIKWFSEKRSISKKTLNALDISSSVESIRQMKKIPGEEHLHDTMVTKKCIAFKYKKDGLLINIKFRDMHKNFKLIQDATKIFYNIDSIKGHKDCVITEGEIDVASYHEAGITNVISVPNGTSISEAEIEEYKTIGKFRNNLPMEYLDVSLDDFKEMETIYIATDDDIPGIKLREELSRRLGRHRCKYVKFSEYKKPDGTPCKDANDVLHYLGPEKLRITLQNAYPYPIDGVTTAVHYWEKLNKIFDEGLQKGYSTGYKSLDAHFNWMPGWLTLVNGYPGEGKSSWLFNLIIISSVLYDWKWGIYSPENYPPENIIDSLAEILVGETADIAFNGTESRIQRMSKQRYIDAIKNHIDRHFYFVDNEDGYTPADLRDIKKSLVRQYGINGFITDPWKNLSHNYEESIDAYLQKELAAEVRLSVKNDLINIISHHPPTPPRNKEKEYPAPSFFELTGGQIWSASSYAMMCIHKFDRTTWKNTLTEIHVQKIKNQKTAGYPTDRNNPVLLNYDRLSGRFYEREDISNLDSPYIVYPFKDYATEKQYVFSGF